MTSRDRNYAILLTLWAFGVVSVVGHAALSLLDIHRHANRPAPVAAHASAPAGAPRLRGYLSPAPPKSPTKLVVCVTGPDGREAGYLFSGPFGMSKDGRALMFSGTAEALATTTPTGPDPPPSPSPGAAAELLAATNRARAAAGLPILLADPRLDRAAQGWAQRCAERGVLDHFGPDGSSPWTRITAAGVKYTSASENAAWGQTSANQVVNDWTSERPPGITGHRDNVLSRAFTHCGGGCAAGRDGQLFWVADYAAE
jgi:uncharacterized protein YkwD